MKLFYLPGSCAVAPHVALEIVAEPYKAVRIERGEQEKPEYLKINPLGRVPALVTPSGDIVTEVPAVLSFIADSYPEAGLLPPVGSALRYRALSWLGYLSSTVHPAFARLWRPERFTTEPEGMASVQGAAVEQLKQAFAYIDAALARAGPSLPEPISVVDCYLFVFGRRGHRLPEPRRFRNFMRHTRAMGDTPAVTAVLAQQGITLEGPSSGPG